MASKGNGASVGGGGFKVTGIDLVQKNLTRLAAEYPHEAARALNVEAEKVMTDSKENYVPVDLGTLKGSGHVEHAQQEGDSIVVRLVYGGAAAPYALAVHEHPSPHSPPSWTGVEVNFHPPGHGPKYLEMPLMKAEAGMANRIVDVLKKVK